jgi:hypothetical protein
MKKIIAISIVVFGLAGCTAREQQLVAAGTVGALAGAVVASGASESYHRSYYRPHPYYAPPRPYYVNPRPQCFTTWDRTPYGMRERLICRRR